MLAIPTFFSTPANVGLRNDAPPGARSANHGPGLVTNSTSDTQQVCILDPVEGRKRRLKRAVQWAARCHTTFTTERVRAFMVTLTYAELDAWAPLHLTAFLKAAREYYRRMGAKFRYVWVGELQQRGAVHYHVLDPHGNYGYLSPDAQADLVALQSEKMVQDGWEQPFRVSKRKGRKKLPNRRRPKYDRWCSGTVRAVCRIQNWRGWRKCLL